MSVPFLHIVADYSAGDLAFSEMTAALAYHLPAEVRWHHTPVSSFDSLGLGFVLAQLGLAPVGLRPENTVIYANCAPRQEELGQRQDNAGEKLVFARLNNGVPLLVVNSGYSLSFVRDQLAELRQVKVADSGSQFRSRDLFPPLVGKLVRGELDFLEEPLDALSEIPAEPESVVAYVDSFGNLKTTLRDDDLAHLQPGQRLQLRLNGHERQVVVAGGSFEVPDGTLTLSPGSSGHDRRFWEVFERGGSASRSFGSPAPGAELSFARQRALLNH